MRKLMVASLAALAVATAPAYADHGHYRGDHYRHYRGDNSAWVGLAVVGALTGLAIMANQGPPRYAAPAYIEPAYPSQPAYPPAAYSAPAPTAPGTWYFCQSSGMYYPNTAACPEGWQAVPASPY